MDDLYGGEDVCSLFLGNPLPVQYFLMSGDKSFDLLSSGQGVNGLSGEGGLERIGPARGRRLRESLLRTVGKLLSLSERK